MEETSQLTPLLFLLKLAWDCRYRIPLIITLGFMALDIRMQFELNIQTRRVRRPRASSSLGDSPSNSQNNSEQIQQILDDSWLTADEAMSMEDESFGTSDEDSSNTDRESGNSSNALSHILHANLNSIAMI